MPALPKDLLGIRLYNEIRKCQEMLTYPFEIQNNDMSRFPIVINVHLKNCPGPVMVDGRISHIYNHEMQLIISDRYPYQKPHIKWGTTIFHPNIMPPEEGGEVCTKLIDAWNFNSDLLSLIKGIESLLINPNPRNPWGTDTCTRAAEYFNKNRYHPPNINEEKMKKKIKIISDEEFYRDNKMVPDDNVVWDDC